MSLFGNGLRAKGRTRAMCSPPMEDDEHFHRNVRPDLDEPTMADAGEVIEHYHLLPVPVPVIQARVGSDGAPFLASDEAQIIIGVSLPVDVGAVTTF